MHARRTRRAFTLVELIVVVVILGILAGIGLVSYQQVTKRAQDRAIETTVASLASEAQAQAAFRADGVFTPEDLSKAVGDLPALADGAPTAAAWDIKTAPYGFVTGYGQLHVRLAADRSAAGVAAMSQSGNCLLTRFTPTGAPTLRLVGAVGASCSGDTALAAAPDAPIDWTDPATAGPPARPTGLAETLTGNNTLVISWAPNTESDLAGYRITVDGIAQPELLTVPSASIPAVPGEHTVTVVAVDKSALSSDPSAPLLAAVPPAGPAQVNAAVVHGVVTVSWTAAPGATSYRIWHQVGTAPAALLGQVLAPVTSITDGNLPAGASLTYSVAAANRGGESAATVAGTPVTAPTAAPTAVTAAASGTSITVGWTAPAGATGFRVYRDGSSTPVFTGTATTFTDAGLATGATHSYVVTASNAAGESVPSATVSATTAPGTPAGLTAAAGDNTVALAWQPSAGADGYRIYRSTDGATFTLLGQATGTTFTDGSLVNGTHYWYAVAAFNGAGESGQSTAASSTPLPPVPAVPAGVTTSVSGTTVTISWSAVDRADGYRVYKNGVLLAQAAGTPATDTLAAGSAATYTVSAYNLAGESAQSQDVAARTKSDAPTGVKATATGTTITVTWAAPAGATSFSVYRDNVSTPAWTGTGTSWADTGLPAGSVHNYTVSATNAAGESAKSIPALATTVPPTPTALTATAGDGTVSLAWGYDAGAQGFRIYRSTDGTTFTLLGQAITRSYTDSTVVNGTTYSYAVAGYNGAGESGQSAPASGRPMPPVVATPTGVTATVTGTTATISWTAVASADGYRLYADGNLVKDVTAGTSTTTPIAAGATVNYTVSAYNLSGESGQSATASGTAAPAAPASVTATAASSTAITVAWTAPAGATGFAVYRDGSTTAVWAGTATSWTDTGLAAGTSHSYTVTATNAAGESPASASASATLTPGTPAGLAATVGDNSIGLSWTASTGATGYRIYRAADNAGTAGTFTMLQQVAGTSYTDATAANGSTYWYAVSAANAGGESGQSTAVSSRPLPPMPAVPTGMTTSVAGTAVTISWTTVSRADGYRVYKNGSYLAQVTGATSTTDTLASGGSATYAVSAYNLAGESAQSAGVAATAKTAAPAGVSATASGTTITVAWTAPTGATGFTVYRDGSATPAFTGTGTGTSWADTALAAGSTHSYTVTATNAAGESPASASVSATVAPTAPTGLTATAGDNTVALTWSATTGAAGYRVYRSVDGATFTLLGQAAAGTSYTDATATNGTSYWYAVSAFNGAGESGQSAAATTKPLPPTPAVPTGVSTSVAGTTVTISWTAVARADGYRVWKNGSYLAQVSGATSATDTLTAGTTATYSVSAINLAGESAQSTGSAATAQTLPPSAVTATPSGSTITVGWTAPTGAVTGYKVYRDGSTTAIWTGTGTSWADTGVPVGTTHSYTVTALSAAGESAPSASVTAGFVPAIPTGLKVSAVSANPVVLTWNASAGATSYTVYRNGVTLATTIPSTTYTDSTVTAGSGYTYAVEAYNGVGGSGASPNVGAVPGSAYAQAVLADSPGGYWRLDSSALRDLSGNGRNGTTDGPVTFGATGAVPAQTNTAATTNSGSVVLPTGSWGSVMTTEFWMKPDAANSIGMPVVAGPTYDLYMNWGAFGFNTGNGDIYGISSAGMAGRWVHVVAEFHTGNVTANQLWIDGQLQTLTQRDSTPLAGAFGSTVNVGGATAFGMRFPGAVDELSVYPGTLSTAQVQAHYNAAGTSYVADVAKSAPLGYWRLGDTGTTTAADSSGQGNAGTYTGSYTQGAVGALAGDPSVTFSATGGHVTGPMSGKLSSVATVEFWMRPTANGNMVPVNLGNYQLYWNSGKLGFNTGNAGDNLGASSNSIPSSSTNTTWTHVVAEFHTTVSQDKLWINGVAQTLVQSGTPRTGVTLNTSDLGIGVGNGGSLPWVGGLDEVALYTRALTQAEITAHAAAK